jgi:RNA polymerase sigma-70 factor (ECF subfamily)
MIGSRFPAVLQAARRGDERAFATMWREFHPPLLRYLRVVTGGAADDVGSETWAAVATSITRFEGDEAAFRAWIFTVARRRAIDHFRREARRPVVPVDPEAFVAVATTAGSDDPGDMALTGLATEKALALVATLPPELAEAVVLRAIAGLDVAQVAAIMHKRPGTIRVLAHRGLRELARRLSEEEHRAVTR